jgi:hypothetical protein
MGAKITPIRPASHASLGPQPDYTAEGKEIARVNQDHWVTIWHTIASMQNLKDLCARLLVNGIFWRDLHTECAKVLLQPLREVTRSEIFMLALPWAMVLWSVAERRQGVEPWEELPCEIR